MSTPLGPQKKLGRKVSDFVMVCDSGDEETYEFRIQCEIVLTRDEALSVLQELFGQGVRNISAFERVRDTVVDKIHPEASPEFRKIVDIAFQERGVPPRTGQGQR